MSSILGIDPGSRVTGFGVVTWDRRGERYVESGCIRTGDGSLAERLSIIYQGVASLVARHAPEVVAVESVFLNRNADSALKLGQARGAAITAAAVNGIPVTEYTPAEIKQAVVGRGNADKSQVQYMVRVLLQLPNAPRPDAADALACALCHCRMSRRSGTLGQ